ncbi:hypothetical protein MKW92_003611 [Papaver armeniacum]|nr:hypothetical protein MKW92_003611 [Papaver armeniacum]
MEKYGELKSYRMDRFDGNSDFSLWKMNMKDYLVVLDLDDALKGPPVRQQEKKDSDKAESSEDITDTWTKMDKKCSSEIRLHLVRKVQGHAAIKGVILVKQLWDSLESLFMAKTMTNKIFIKGLLHDMRMEQNTPIMDHISAFDSLISKLEAVGDKLNDQDKSLVIRTLP